MMEWRYDYCNVEEIGQDGMQLKCVRATWEKFVVGDVHEAGLLGEQLRTSIGLVSIVSAVGRDTRPSRHDSDITTEY